MTKKRSNESNGSSRSSKSTKVEVVNAYDGYKPTSADTKLDSFNVDQINHEEIQKYINERKPLTLEYDGQLQNLNIGNFQLDKITETLHYDQLLLVERKYKGGFGSGTQRIQMKFEEFMEKVKQGDEYYLTTQYVDNEPAKEESDEEDDDDVSESYTPECSPKHDGDEAGDEDEEEAEGFDIPEIPNDQFSDTDSIDMNDIHDDFDDIEGPDDEDQPEGDPVSSKFQDDPLYETEAIRRIKEYIQKPLTNLVKDDTLPLKIDLLKNLVPQQVNLWIGSAAPQTSKVDVTDLEIDPKADDLGLGRGLIDGGSSSGLHHDHSDNLYILVKGCKRFTIYPPSDAENLNLVGDINKVHSSGVIDYKNNLRAPAWRKVRDDGALETEVAKWRLDNEADISSKEREELIKLIEEEDEILDNAESNNLDKDGIKHDPPSFSTIPPIVLHLDQIKDDKLRTKITELAQQKWPNFFKCTKMEVLVKPGTLLYLPAGWFHEVTSYGTETDDNTHIAINYWFAPPNDKSKLYKDSYWSKDFERTEESCTLFKNGIINV